MTVAVLFARADSTYKALPDCDVWDADRDARRWPGGCPVVAHPPCRAWGRLRTFARPRPDEMNLARLAVALVREFGGVLEHPAGSTLWKAQKLPRPGERDQYGGWTLEVNRCCTDGARNACSMLYGSAWRAARALGYRRLVTYTLPEEGGASLRAAGWKLLGQAGGGSWDRKSRPRVDTAPTQQKLAWEAA